MKNAHPRRIKLVDPRWQLGVACVVSMMMLGSGALYLLGAKMVAHERMADRFGPSTHQFLILAFDVVYFLGLVTVVQKIVIRMTHSVAGPAFAIERGLRQLSEGRVDVRFQLREGDTLTEVANAASALVESLERDRARVEAEIKVLEAAAPGSADVAASVERLRALITSPSSSTSDVVEAQSEDQSEFQSGVP